MVPEHLDEGGASIIRQINKIGLILSVVVCIAGVLH